MKSLVFADNAMENLQRALLAESPNEAAAVLIAGHASDGNDLKLLVRECHQPRSNEYETQEPFRVVIRPSFFAPLIKRARREGWSIILAHTHPFSDEAAFSELDDLGEQILIPSIFARAASRPHGALVLARRSCAARFWKSPESPPIDADVVMEVGRDLNLAWRPHTSLLSNEPEFDRSIRAFGAHGQAALTALTVGIVGLGGLGSIVAQQLAHLGVKNFILLDPDDIDATNLNRVVGANRSAIGRPKVRVAEDLIAEIRPDAKVNAVHGDVLRAEDARPLLSSHFLFCCTDSHGSRALINQMAYQYMIPAIDLGVRIQVESGTVDSIIGRIQMLAPGLPCLVCQNLLDAEEVRRDLLTPEERKRDPYIVGHAEPQPAVISLNGAVASFGVTMMLSAVTGMPDAARHQIIRFDRGVVRVATSTSAPDCVVCSLRGALGRGDLWPLPWRPR